MWYIPAPVNPLASAAAVVVQGNEQGRVRGIGATHQKPSRQGLLDVRRNGHRLALAATLAKHEKPLAHDVTMADVEGRRSHLSEGRARRQAG